MVFLNNPGPILITLQNETPLNPLRQQATIEMIKTQRLKHQALMLQLRQKLYRLITPQRFKVLDFEIQTCLSRKKVIVEDLQLHINPLQQQLLHPQAQVPLQALILTVHKTPVQWRLQEIIQPIHYPDLALVQSQIKSVLHVVVTMGQE